MRGCVPLWCWDFSPAALLPGEGCLCRYGEIWGFHKNARRQHVPVLLPEIKPWLLWKTHATVAEQQSLSFGARAASWGEAGNSNWGVKALMKFVFSYTGKIIIISGVETFMFLLPYRIAEVSECWLLLCLRADCVSRTGNAEGEQGAKSPLPPHFHPYEMLITRWLISLARIQKQIPCLPLQLLPPTLS